MSMYRTLAFDKGQDNPAIPTNYCAIGQLGATRNPSVQDPFNPSNPLTYSVLPTLNSLFLHGASGDSALFGRVWFPHCQNFMAEYGTQTTIDDPFIQAYFRINIDTSWPNCAVIDRSSMETCYNLFRVEATLGDQLFHNVCERRYLTFPSVSYSFQPFDPTTANSPMVRFYNPTGSIGRPTICRLQDKDTIEKDTWLHAMIENPGPVLDVWTRIYAAYLRGHLPALKGTKVEAFFQRKKEKLDFLYHTLRNAGDKSYDKAAYNMDWKNDCGAT